MKEFKSKQIARELRRFAKREGMSIEQMAVYFGKTRAHMYFIVDLNSPNRRLYANKKMLEAIGYRDTGGRIHDRIYEKLEK